MTAVLTDTQWQQYEADGYLHLGKLLTDDELAGLQQRIDQIMLGQANLDYDRMMMQLDSDDGTYGKAGPQSKGHKGATLNYRKIEQLEFDRLFLAYMQRPLFEHICRRVHAPDTPVDCFRAMFMNKPAQKGTILPWHQDRWTDLDRDPEITIWTAMDRATKANGCLQVIPGSHKLGLINPEHDAAFLTEDQAAEHCPPDKAVHIELAPGEVVLLHNWLLHASDINKTDIPRRAFSACYMDGRTHSESGLSFSRIFGQSALTPETIQA